MGLRGAQLVGVLLAWMAVGFAVQSLTADYQYELTEETGQDTPPPTLAGKVLRYAVAGVLGITGLVLVTRDPGEGVAPGVALGSEQVRERRPRRCWNCRKKWPADAERCPHCGAERLR